MAGNLYGGDADAVPELLEAAEDRTKWCSVVSRE